MKKTILYILLAMAVSACIYPYEAELEGEVPERLVVSGDILIGEEFRIDLGYVMPLSADVNKTRSAPSDAVLVVENDRGKSFPGQPVGDGGFLVDMTSAPDAARYRLNVRLADGREYSTPWEGVNQAPIIAGLSYDYDDDYLYLTCSLNGRDSNRNYRLDYEEVWEYHAHFMPDLIYEDGEYEIKNRFKDYYYCWNSRSSTEPFIASSESLSKNRVKDCNFLSIKCTDDRLNQLYSIQLKASSISLAAKVYLEHLHSLSGSTGDLFTPTPSEMRGNVSCTTNPDEQVVGYVSVCRRAFKRIFINTENIYRYPVNPESLLFYPEPDEEGNYNLEGLFKYCSPVFFEPPVPTATNVQWGLKRCVDCRAWGGTKTKPEWWPNDDE